MLLIFCLDINNISLDVRWRPMENKNKKEMSKRDKIKVGVEVLVRRTNTGEKI